MISSNEVQKQTKKREFIGTWSTSPMPPACCRFGGWTYVQEYSTLDDSALDNICGVPTLFTHFQLSELMYLKKEDLVVVTERM